MYIHLAVFRILLKVEISEPKADVRTGMFYLSGTWKYPAPLSKTILTLTTTCMVCCYCMSLKHYILSGCTPDIQPSAPVLQKCGVPMSVDVSDDPWTLDWLLHGKCLLSSIANTPSLSSIEITFILMLHKKFMLYRSCNVW